MVQEFPTVSLDFTEWSVAVIITTEAGFNGR